VKIANENNLNDAESFYLLHSLGNLGNDGQNLELSSHRFLTNNLSKEIASNVNVEAPLEPVAVGTT
jgi:hypothetical protein